MPAVGGGMPAEEEDPEETPPEGVMADKTVDKGVVGDVTVGVVAEDEQVLSLTQLPYVCLALCLHNKVLEPPSYFFSQVSFFCQF